MSLGYGYFSNVDYDLMFKTFKCRDKELTCRIIDNIVTGLMPYLNSSTKLDISCAYKLTFHAIQYRPIWKKYNNVEKRFVLLLLLRCRADLIKMKAINNWTSEQAGVDFNNPKLYKSEWEIGACIDGNGNRQY